MNNKLSIIGAANLDIVGCPSYEYINATSNLGKVSFSLGGVARNIAENLALLGLPVELICAVGDDWSAARIIDGCNARKIDLNYSLRVKNSDSAIYLSVTDQRGEMQVAINDMKINEALNVEFFKTLLPYLKQQQLLVIDCNIPEQSLEFLLTNLNQAIFIEAVSVSKVIKVRNLLTKIDTIHLNLLEARALLESLGEAVLDFTPDQICWRLAGYGVKNILLTLGKSGLYAHVGKIQRFFPTKAELVLNSNGAGDSFFAGYIYGVCSAYSTNQTIEMALNAAKITLACIDTVNEQLCVNDILKGTR